MFHNALSCKSLQDVVRRCNRPIKKKKIYIKTLSAITQTKWICKSRRRWQVVHSSAGRLRHSEPPSDVHGSRRHRLCGRWRRRTGSGDRDGRGLFSCRGSLIKAQPGSRLRDSPLGGLSCRGGGRRAAGFNGSAAERKPPAPAVCRGCRCSCSRRKTLGARGPRFLERLTV